MGRGIVKVSKALLIDVLHLEGISIDAVATTSEDLSADTVSLLVSGDDLPDVPDGAVIPEIDVIHHTEVVKTTYKARPWPPKLETR